MSDEQGREKSQHGMPLHTKILIGLIVGIIAGLIASGKTAVEIEALFAVD